jgi:hypothetical protein
MNKGVLIIAHNSTSVDYAKTAVIAGGLAKKNLQVPVSLITDQYTVDQMKEFNTYTDAVNVFEKIILIDRPTTSNRRILHNGAQSDRVPFLNSTRSSIYNLTPYEKTLLIDSDFLIMSSHLNNYWKITDNILISDSMNDIAGDRIGILDKWVSETGVHLYWATTVMFSKNKESDIFFQLVEFIKENYNYYSDLYRFDNRQYRNDISFSIAMHILNGFEKSVGSLPSILTVQGIDTIEAIGKHNDLKILVCKGNEHYLTSIKDRDVHIMNKQSIIQHYESLKELL